MQKLWYACHSFLFLQEFRGKGIFLEGGCLSGQMSVCGGRIFRTSMKKHILQMNFDQNTKIRMCIEHVLFLLHRK